MPIPAHAALDCVPPNVSPHEEDLHVSQRNQSRRRRAYGRRQHEVRERRDRSEPWDMTPQEDHEDSRLDVNDPMLGIVRSPVEWAEGSR
jgi:hypothetical protein